MPQYQFEVDFTNAYLGKLEEIARALQSAPSIQKQAHDSVVRRMPTFIYMSDYRAFTGTAQLDEVRQRKDSGRATEEDKTVLMIMELSGLRLEEEVSKGNSSDREQRQYDLDDASATITRTISERWRQRRYEVAYRADGQLFYTFVKDDRDPSLIRLEERSKGFQWFFSFDLMFMYESGGTFKNCVLLLDEPGLHLHPDAQRDLLKRMEAYVQDNILIYSTHLPFMIDLSKPDSIRVLNETTQGTTVSSDLTHTQPEAKLVLQAALGMSGRSSYLVANQNLVVEGVDDYWIITELSNLLKRLGKDGLSNDIFITPAGGASEAAYIATFMVGQQLDVVVLLDTDRAGDDAQDSLVKKWLTKYATSRATILRLGETVGSRAKEYSIEDLFPEDYYLQHVRTAYAKQLEAAGISSLELRQGTQLCKRVEAALNDLGITFNKGSVAKLIRKHLSSASSITDIPEQTLVMAQALVDAINAELIT
jgi:predicted ATP-dependent endonuclease of OLD family